MIISLLALMIMGFVNQPVGASGLRSQNGEASSHRFQVLDEFESEAVLDTVTGLVWERSPSTRETLWTSAPSLCALKSVGGRRGWRLPTFYELMSLVDPAVQGQSSNPTLPRSNPFLDVKASTYWSVTSLSADPFSAYAVDFSLGDVTSRRKSTTRGYWCVLSHSSSEEVRFNHSVHQSSWF